MYPGYNPPLLFWWNSAAASTIALWESSFIQQLHSWLGLVCCLCQCWGPGTSTSLGLLWVSLSGSAKIVCLAMHIADTFVTCYTFLRICTVIISTCHFLLQCSNGNSLVAPIVVPVSPNLFAQNIHVEDRLPFHHIGTPITVNCYTRFWADSHFCELEIRFLWTNPSVACLWESMQDFL